MNKKSYTSAPAGPAKELTGPGSPDMSEQDTTTETGGRGFNLTEMTSTYDNTDPDKYDKETFVGGNKTTNKPLMDMLVNLGDDLDRSGEEALASFADFLIKKFAQASVVKINYAEMFNQLMIKVANADLVNTNDTLKKLAKIYSRTLSLEYLKTDDLEGSKASAYKKTLHRAEQYLSEG